MPLKSHSKPLFKVKPNLLKEALDYEGTDSSFDLEEEPVSERQWIRYKLVLKAMDSGVRTSEGIKNIVTEMEAFIYEAGNN